METTRKPISLLLEAIKILERDNKFNPQNIKKASLDMRYNKKEECYILGVLIPLEDGNIGLFKIRYNSFKFGDEWRLNSLIENEIEEVTKKYGWTFPEININKKEFDPDNIPGY